MTRFALAVSVLVSLTLGSWSASARAGIVVETDVAIPLRDGVVLKADVWRPAPTGRFPVLVYRTPYEKGEEAAYNAKTFEAAVARGYAVVINDVRGRYASGGVYSPYRHE